MRRALKYYRIMWFRYDILAGISVFLVALPLCLGISLASGAPLYAGLLAGIIGGLAIPLISGSALAVSGPAAGLTTLVSSTILLLGSYQNFLLAVCIAGLFQILLGILKIGAIGNYFPSSVIKGMLAAIGIILISKQIPLAIGYDQPDFWTSGFASLFSTNNFYNKFENFNQHITRGAVLISLLSLSILIFFKSNVIQKKKYIPAPLVVVVVGILANLLFSKFESLFMLRPSQLVNIPADIFSKISFPDFSQVFYSADIWKNGLEIGLLATLETLLCIEAIDKLDRHNRITPINRELVAQGCGNILCGMLGAIPITAVVVRGAANVDAGGRTKLSAFTHGLFLLLAVLFAINLLNKIPYASLSAILLITGFNLTNPKLYLSVWRLGWKQFLPFSITILVILFSDLLIGVCIGLLISIYFIIQNNFKADYKLSVSTKLGMNSFQLKLNSNVTFLNKYKIKKTLDQVPEYSILTIDGSECNFIDHDILEIISEFDLKAKDRHIELHLKGIEKVNITDLH